MPLENPLEAKTILDWKVTKRTRGKEYYEYLIKWKDKPVEYSTWMSVAYLQQSNYSLEDLMSRSS